MQNFLGRDGFIWFTGVVEDRDDPDKLGRVRIRCVGYHTDDVNKIPTADLPWAWVMMPTTTSAMGGLGEGMPFIVEGSWVVGFFRDPDQLQEPIIIGTLPGVPSETQTVDKGFNDPRNEGATQSEELYTYKPDYGPYPIRTEDSDVSRLAKNDENNIHPEIEERDNAVTEEVPTANEKKILGDADFTVDIASTWTDKLATNIDLTAITWKEPKTTDDSIRGADATGRNPETKEDRVAPYKRRNTEYPYNRTYETESGHIIEIDDTPYAERMYQKHKSGTFTEIDADGNKVTRVVGQNYEIVAGNNFCNIKGDVNLTIDSNCKTYIKGDWDIQVDGNKNEVVKGNVTESFGTNVVLNTHSTTLTGFRTKTILGLENENVVGAVAHIYGGIKTETVAGDVSETFSGNQTTQITGNLDIDAARIDLN